jgi:hypothetical protein
VALGGARSPCPLALRAFSSVEGEMTLVDFRLRLFWTRLPLLEDAEGGFGVAAIGLSAGQAHEDAEMALVTVGGTLRYTDSLGSCS